MELYLGTYFQNTESKNNQNTIFPKKSNDCACSWQLYFVRQCTSMVKGKDGHTLPHTFYTF